jgi:hypothetical protein
MVCGTKLGYAITDAPERSAARTLTEMPGKGGGM